MESLQNASRLQRLTIAILSLAQLMSSMCYCLFEIFYPHKVFLKGGSAMAGRKPPRFSLSKVEAQHGGMHEQSPIRNRVSSFARTTGEHSLTDPEAAVNYIIDKEKRKQKLQKRHKKKLEHESGNGSGHKRHHRHHKKRVQCPLDHSFHQVDVVYDEVHVPGRPYLRDMRCSGGCDKSIIADDEFEIGILPSPETPVYVCKNCHAHAICYGCWNRDQFPKWTTSILNYTS